MERKAPLSICVVGIAQWSQLANVSAIIGALFGIKELDGHRISVEPVAQTVVCARHEDALVSLGASVAKTYCFLRHMCNRFMHEHRRFHATRVRLRLSIQRGLHQIGWTTGVFRSAAP